MKLKTLWTERKGVLIGLAIWMFLAAGTLYAGTYLSSSHGNTSYGVNRGSTSQYTKGNCAHCHEMHASIDGSEPAPSSGSPSKFTLFYTNHTSQTDNFCFKCHDNTTTVAATAITNRSYSYRAGGWTADALNDILEAFTTGGPTSILSVHNLGDIRTFITGQWGYTADSNPCAACHSAHALQGDPANSGGAAKSSATRGYPVSRPSQHSANVNTWGLWGDGAGEKMSDYSATYQAPYRFNSVVAYEPDGSATTDGSNMTDFNTFCTDCHNASNTIWSTALNRNLRTINWNDEKHGKGVSDGLDGAGYILSPYSTNKVLACTDCHEPHGAPNVGLIRKEVNGGVLSGQITSNYTTILNRELSYLCMRCHKTGTSKPANPFNEAHHNDQACNPCHGIVPGDFVSSSCGYCHYHGAVVSGYRVF